MTTSNTVSQIANQLINYLKTHPESLDDHDNVIKELSQTRKELQMAISNHPATDSSIDLIDKLLLNRLGLTQKYLKKDDISQAVYSFQICTHDYLHEIQNL